jgi:hypothetical protein
MKEKRESVWGRLVILAAAAALLVSFVALTASVGETEKPELTASFKPDVVAVTAPTTPGTKSADPIIWNNGGTVAGGNILSSQNDAVYPFVSQMADDFMFTEDMDVTDVHWWGGFWNGPPNEVDPCPFYIYIYADDGTGNMPTGAGMPDPAPTALATYYFPGLTGYPLDPNGFYEYDVDLSPAFSATAGVKYWIAIQADFGYPPQWGWTVTSGLQLHQALQGFPFLGTPFWTDPSPPGVDLAYYLTGVPSGPPWPDHKMHFPQLPDLIGWDVNATSPIVLADDWQCSRTGPVEDIHFWGSWKDQDGIPGTDEVGQLQFFQFGIWSNLPVGHPQNPFPYSVPGTLLWFMEEWVPGMPTDPPTMEAWYDPWIPWVVPNDHVPYWQYDFVDIPDPFVQQQDSIYWLSISAVLADPQGFQWGWKNSRDHFEDDAVFMSPTGEWVEMYEPPRYNEFLVQFGPDGIPFDWDGTNYYGEGFYGYEYWWNMWFYDNPFTYAQPKLGVIEFYVDPIGPQPWLEFAINWSSDLWSLEGEPGRPPLPGPEEFYVERQIIGVLEPYGFYSFPIDIPYNPEWISVDFVAMDVVISGWTQHECVGTSLDLAFVITGEEPPYLCGDANGNGVVGPDDVVYILNYLFRPGSPPPIPMAAGDVNCDGGVNGADVVYLINWLFRNGPDPCDPNDDGIPDC